LFGSTQVTPIDYDFPVESPNTSEKLLLMPIGASFGFKVRSPSN
jgi:hypothetical protein